MRLLFSWWIPFKNEFITYMRGYKKIIFIILLSVIFGVIGSRIRELHSDIESFVPLVISLYLQFAIISVAIFFAAEAGNVHNTALRTLSFQPCPRIMLSSLLIARTIVAVLMCLPPMIVIGIAMGIYEHIPLLLLWSAGVTITYCFVFGMIGTLISQPMFPAFIIGWVWDLAIGAGILGNAGKALSIRSHAMDWLGMLIGQSYTYDWAPYALLILAVISLLGYNLALWKKEFPTF